jgi:outer membrane lipoprotein-sorting protein
MPARRTALASGVFSVTLLFASCAQNQKSGTASNTNAIVFSTTPPFETQEPERYRATRTIRTTRSGGLPSFTQGLIARDGELRREESENNGQRVVYLTLPEGRFVLLPDEKLFAAATSEAASNNEEPSETSPDRLLHTEMVTPGYQKLGAETVNGQDLQKYRVVVNNSAGENVSVGETLLWFDENLHMPVKTEISSPNGTRVTTELSDVVFKVDKNLFAIPKDYQKIEFNKLRERLKSNQP